MISDKIEVKRCEEVSLMNKPKIIIVLTILMTFLIPWNMFGDLSPVNEISLNELEGLIMSRSQDYQNISEAVVVSEKTKHATKAGVNAALDGVRNAIASFEGSTVDDATKAAVNYLLTVQEQSLQNQLDSLSATTPDSTLLSVEKAQNTLIANYEDLYISCKNLERQIQYAEKTKEIAEKQYKVALLQYDIGLISEIALIKAESQMRSMETSLQLVRESHDNLLQLFNVTLSQRYDTEIALADLPEILDIDINNINAEEDYELAKLHSYNIQINEDQVVKQDDETRKFEKNFYRTYQTLLDKQKSLQDERIKNSYAEESMRIAELKHELGILSDLQLELEKSLLIANKNTFMNSQDALFQAYRHYEWAKSGLILEGLSSVQQ